MTVKLDCTAKCPHFSECGGCSFLDKPYQDQLALKRQQIKEIFPEWNCEVHPSPEPFFYRHKVQLPFGSAAGKILLGCYSKDSHRVIDQRKCLIQDRDLTAAAYSVRDWAKKFKLTAYNEKNNTGFLRHVLLRKGAGTGQILIGLVTNGGRPSGSRFLASKLVEMVNERLSPAAQVAGIVQNVNVRRTNVVLGTEEHTWWGSSFLKENLGPYRFKLGISTFFQVNPYQTPNLYDEVLKWVPEGSGVLDLYCGTGSISLWISSRASEILGIEQNRASVSAARAAVAANDVKNVRFMAGDASSLFDKGCKKGYRVAVVDPPRKGLEPAMVESLKNSDLQRLIYVSCNPHSLATNIEELKPQFCLQALNGFDMFPHTSHIECVAVLERK
ncbi:MAG: 23S rRNA (uracil(1939)-C(5))-methyltransferase RlmD [Fibrobacter sp.]|nr:23S rRNA (uracil(1939)-C(5))-methyltransferase RlmD [Fibrobacter sp.]